VLLELSRQKLPVYTETAPDDVLRGGYVMCDCPGTPAVILIGTGSELQLAVAASERLAANGVQARVVSLPCFELFDAQGDSYRERVLPRAVRARVSVEADVTFGWERYVGAGEVVAAATTAMSLVTAAGRA
jgi:transketolase